MKGFSFVRQSKLHDVCGRVNYISSHEKQEYLYATYETNPEPFWDDLARECQQEYKRSGTKGKCIEARELVIALPKSLQRYDPNILLRKLTEEFKKKYGVECSSALHHNHRRTNYHIHLVYSERMLLDEPTKKTATRNMFYDKSGKRVRSKKEILDSNGALKPDCFIIPKGEVYEQHMFTSKDEYFKSRDFIKEVKHFFTDKLNELSYTSEKLEVFKKDSPYLATKKIGKNNPNEKDIREDNKVRDEWNKNVNNALNFGLTSDAMNQIKKSEIIEPIKEATERIGDDHNSFRQIVLRAADTARNCIRQFRRAEPEVRKKLLTSALTEFIAKCKAPEKHRKIRERDDRSR